MTIIQGFIAKSSTLFGCSQVVEKLQRMVLDGRSNADIKKDAHLAEADRAAKTVKQDLSKAVNQVGGVFRSDLYEVQNLI